ncbi:Lipoprotein [Frankia sp. AgKG'84/4]
MCRVNRSAGRGASFVVAAGMALGGCGGAHHVAPAPASTPSRIASASPFAVPGTDALVAYRGMWADWAAMASTGDYQNPRLADHVSGRALSLIYRAVYTNQHNGQFSRGNPMISPKVTAEDPAGSPGRATISDCVNTSNWLVYDSSGHLQAGTPGGRRAVQALALKTDRTWKINQLVIQDVGSC